MGLLDFFKTTAETSEQPLKRSLRSRHYKANYKKVKEISLDYAKERKLTVEHVDDTHHELFLRHKKFHMIITLLQIKPTQTSVDIKVQKYSFFGFNTPTKEIAQMIDYLDKHLTIVRI